ncbi:exported protein of unknown function [Nitrosotalea devaniterrae]|uniref:Uncharacterized protein n=1 Tax=Nitrosotalea devaniterrae TaxID=1078905 RepID=A0A128A619_9ARCH|nr:exported protein of unknown function [Candidatus Nitrosotalea devanaterra]
MDRKTWAVLIVGGLIMSTGLSFVLNFGSWVHHDVNFLYVSNPINLENGTIFVILNFTTTDAFVAQKSMDVNMQVVEKSVIYENGTIKPFPHPLSNDYRIGSYNLMIISARNSDSTYPHTELNYTGAFISPSDYKQKPMLQINGNDKVIFPLAGDYTAYLIVIALNHPEQSIPLGRVMNVSPPETSLQVSSNNIGIGLSIIVVGLTIVQIGLASHTIKKHRSSE